MIRRTPFCPEPRIDPGDFGRHLDHDCFPDQLVEIDMYHQTLSVKIAP